MKESKRASRIVGVDYGLVRIGIALSDESKMIASPLIILAAEKKLELTAQKFVETLQKSEKDLNYQVEEIVIGLPLQMNGKMGMLADEVKHFVAVLQKLVACPIKTWDERLTTVMAERAMHGAISRKKRSKVVDTVTATIILQNYLDFKSPYTP